MYVVYFDQNIYYVHRARRMVMYVVYFDQNIYYVHHARRMVAGLIYKRNTNISWAT
jgi:hypothetical protein